MLSDVMFYAALIIALTVFFIHALFWDGMIFAYVHYEVEDRLPKWIRKPLYDCVICMTPWYGTAIIFFGKYFGYFSQMEGFHIVLTIATAAGINVILQQFITFRRKCNCGREKEGGA